MTGVQTCALPIFSEPVLACILSLPDHPGAPPDSRDEAAALRVGRLDAGPRFGQRGFREPQPIVDRNDVGSVVGVEHLGTDEVIADQASGDRVAVGGAATA